MAPLGNLKPNFSRSKKSSKSNPCFANSVILPLPPPKVLEVGFESVSSGKMFVGCPACLSFT